MQNRDSFAPMLLPEKFEPKGISAGYGHSAVWSTQGELFMCGIPVEFRRVIRMSTMTDIYIPFGTIYPWSFDKPLILFLCSSIDEQSL